MISIAMPRIHSCLLILLVTLSVHYVCSSPSDYRGYTTTKTPTDVEKKMILILADGIRYDYTRNPSLKGFQRMAKKGVKAEYVQPIFPSNSYPNWYTIVTGEFRLEISNKKSSFTGSWFAFRLAVTGRWLNCSLFESTKLSATCVASTQRAMLTKRRRSKSGKSNQLKAILMHNSDQFTFCIRFASCHPLTHSPINYLKREKRRKEEKKAKRGKRGEG